jgi:hypothetical protein
MLKTPSVTTQTCPVTSGSFAAAIELVAQHAVVGVLEDAFLDALLHRGGQADAVDDARVVERVGEDQSPGSAKVG